MTPDYSDRRKNPRIDHCGDYYIAPTTHERVTCLLQNISVTGACISSDILLKMGQEIELHVCRSRDLPLKAQVVWIKGQEYGVSFLLDTTEAFANISYIINNEISK
jgi:hypothetical protein